MHQEYSELNGSRNDTLNKENLMINHGHVLPPRRMSFKEAKMGSAVRSDGLIAINDRDETSFPQIGAINFRAFDHESRLEMHSHHVKKEMRGFLSFVGS